MSAQLRDIAGNLDFHRIYLKPASSTLKGCIYNSGIVDIDLSRRTKIVEHIELDAAQTIRRGHREHMRIDKGFESNLSICSDSRFGLVR